MRKCASATHILVAESFRYFNKLLLDRHKRDEGLRYVEVRLTTFFSAILVCENPWVRKFPESEKNVSSRLSV